MARLLVLDEVGSTNDVCADHGRAGVESGFAIAARRQTRGRGRRGATWECLDEENLFLSVLHRTQLPLGNIAGLTLDVGVALASLLTERGVAARVKWPNDLLVGKAKVGGILCELHEVYRERFVVIGVGLNVNAQILPHSLKYEVTSLQRELGARVDVEALTNAVLQVIRQSAEAYEVRQQPNVEAFLAFSDDIGATVQDEQGRQGTITGIASDGALMLLWERAHAPEPFIAGELTRVAKL